MPLILAGIDEAGYGPLLGPLCVGLSVFRIDQWEPGEPAPNLWKHLGRAVSRRPSDKHRRIAVNDSKKLKLPNSSVRLHPLTHLERGVLAFLACRGLLPDTDAALFEVLGTTLSPEPWYRRPPAPCPVALSADEIRIGSNTLRREIDRRGVSCLDIRCEAVGEGDFNDILRDTGSKAEVTARAIGRHLNLIWDNLADPETAGQGGPRVVCDRQGGRTTYADFIRAALPGAQVNIVEESPRRSRYEAHGTRADGRQRQMTFLFQPEAEDAHLPVALASMTAKLVRETLMARFNAYWCARMPELKPTAGYLGDARRWLADAEPGLAPAEREALIRRA